MSKKNKIASLDDLRDKKARGDLHHDIDAAERGDLGADFWAKAEIVNPPEKKSIHLRVDADVLEFFKQGGKGHLTRMNAVLRRYMKAQMQQQQSHTID